MSDKRQKVIDSLLRGNPSPRKRIAAMCASCIYDSDAMGAGTWRMQVRDCTSKDCPLYPERPLPTIAESSEGVNSEDSKGLNHERHNTNQEL